MAATDAVFLRTDEYGSGFPSDAADSVESIWNDDIDVNHNGYYDISISVGGTVVLDDPDDFDDAWQQVKEYFNGGNYWTDNYDAVLVIDNRSLSGPSGRAYVGTAGGDFAFGYCESEAVQTNAHELGHIYGCSHSGSTTHWKNFGAWSHDLMGYSGVDPSCEDEDPDLTRESTFKECAQDRIRTTLINM